jgi:hypothetical protein
MYDTATNPLALRDFKARLPGELILPDDDGYESARGVCNGWSLSRTQMIPPTSSRSTRTSDQR